MKRSMKLRVLALATVPLWPAVFLFWIGCLVLYGLNKPGPQWLLDAATALMDDI